MGEVESGRQIGQTPGNVDLVLMEGGSAIDTPHRTLLTRPNPRISYLLRGHFSGHFPLAEFTPSPLHGPVETPIRAPI